jgi:RNA-directed DNA polymerase
MYGRKRGVTEEILWGISKVLWEVRGPIVALKPDNTGGAKGSRKEKMIESKTHQQELPLVPQGKQGGEVRARWAWTEGAVWSDRMLEALEKGVKGNQWFSLIDKVYSEKNLWAAWLKVQSNAGGCGVDGITVGRFAKDSTNGLLALKEEMRLGTYTPKPVRRVWIPKPGTDQKRPLGIPTVRDRVVQTALRNVLEPIFEHCFAGTSYGFRPGRGCKDALMEVQRLLDMGQVWVVDADLKGYFDTIPHDKLMSRVRERVADGKVLGLIEGFLKQGILDELSLFEAGEVGTPQGAVISPLLANIYLNPLDHLMAKRHMVRYADDFVILCASQEEAQAALHEVQTWVQEQGLTLHPEKTRIVDASVKGGFDFLGYHFERGTKWPCDKAYDKMKAKVTRMTPRISGDSIPSIIARLNPVLRGWFEYFKHGSSRDLRQLDCYTRNRLRAILRRRALRTGLGGISASRKWNIAYFAKEGLFDMLSAHSQALQSSH